MLAPLNARLSPAGLRAHLPILLFHRVHARPDPLFPHEPDARRFEAKMKALARDWTVLPLPQAVALLREGGLPARALCITFDDGYADNFSIAAPILKRWRLPATFFISTGFMSGEVMWNDRVIEAVRATRRTRLDLADRGLGAHEMETPQARRACVAALLAAIKYLPQAARDEAVAAIVRQAAVVPAHELMMRPAQVVALLRAGHSIGAHTVTHPILSRLAPEAAQAEIARARDALEALLQARVGLFAYPNGKPGEDYLPEHVAMVRGLGFDAALTTAAGVAGAGCDFMQLPRYTPWRPGAWGFRLALTWALLQSKRARTHRG